MPASERPEMIRACIEKALAPTELEIVDESDLHTGHGGHGGAGHFRVRIVSGKFEGETPIARHKLVYAAVDSLMPAEIHALSIEALTPGESRQNHEPG